MNGKPSDLKSHPYMSVFARGEHEGVAVYLKDLLIKTGDEFRFVTYTEFKEYWDSLGFHKTFFLALYSYFIQIQPYLESADMASTFSDRWKNDLLKVN